MLQSKVRSPQKSDVRNSLFTVSSIYDIIMFCTPVPEPFWGFGRSAPAARQTDSTLPDSVFSYTNYMAKPLPISFEITDLTV